MTIRVARADMLPDSPSWVNRFTFHSDSGHDYTIAQSRVGRYFGCSCPRWRFKRDCKHLQALGLKANAQPCEVSIEYPQFYRRATNGVVNPLPAEEQRAAERLASRERIERAVQTRPEDILTAMGINRARRAVPPPPEPQPVKKPKRAYCFDD
jgi:hypothetical protein